LVLDEPQLARLVKCPHCFTSQPSWARIGLGRIDTALPATSDAASSREPRGTRNTMYSKEPGAA